MVQYTTVSFIDSKGAVLADNQPGACHDQWHCDPDLKAHTCDQLDRDQPCPTCGERPVNEAGLRHALAHGWSHNQFRWARQNPDTIAHPWW